jgi:hypothetical protein
MVNARQVIEAELDDVPREEARDITIRMVQVYAPDFYRKALQFENLQAQLDERYDHPRCGECDNERVCMVHDCPANPKYTESQLCENCAGCIDPRSEGEGGPCNGCTCPAEDVI